MPEDLAAELYGPPKKVEAGSLAAELYGPDKPPTPEKPSAWQLGARYLLNTPLASGPSLPTVDQMVPPDGSQRPATLGRVGLGVLNSAVAPAQFLAHMVGSNIVDPAADAIQNYADKNLQKSATGEAMGAALPFLATAGGSAAPSAATQGLTATQRVKALLGTIGKGAGSGAVAAPALTPEAGVQDNGDFWTRKGKEAVVGGLLGGAFGLGGATLGWLSDKAKNALAGTKLGDRLGISLEVKPQYRGGPGNPGALERSAELDQAGIPSHTVGDVTGDRSVRKMEDAIGRNNPEMDAFRQKTINETSAYADEVLNRLNTAMRQEKWSSLADVEKAAASGGKRQKEAQALLEAVKNSGDDWKLVAKTDGGMELIGRKLKADSLYDHAEAIAKPLGNVEPTKYAESLKGAIGKLEGNAAYDKDLVPYLKGILADVESGRNLNFAQMRETRSILNRRIDSLTNPNTTVQDANMGRKVLGDVVSGLESDLDRFASNKSPELRSAWEKASTYYKDSVVPYKETGIAKALADQDPVKLVNLLNGKNDYIQSRTLDLMGEKGRAAVRAGIIDQALTAGGKTQRGVMGLDMSPMGVAADLEKSINNGIGKLAFNNRDDIWAAQGMARVLRAVDRISNLSGVSTTTGATGQEIGALVKGDVTALGAIERLHAWVSRDNLMRLYTDPKGRALMQIASSLKPNSPAMVNMVEKEIPAFLGVTSAKNVSPFNSAYQVTMPAAATKGNSDTFATKN